MLAGMSRRRPRRDSPALGREWRFTAEGWRSNARLRVAAVAARQKGRIRYDQLRALGISEGTIGRWCDEGYLFWELPRVYAVGHPGRTPESDLAAAALYAGPGGELSHATTVWWLGLLKYPPKEIHVSTPRRVQNYKNIVVHGRRKLERILHKGLPITPPSQAILDFAATGTHELLRFVLANAEYQGLLDVDALNASIGQGVDGTRALRAAIRVHLPQLALTRSDIERLLLMLCERFGLPIPLVNTYIGDWLVDAVWPHAKVIVEVDGIRGHRTKAQIERDHQRDLELRALGYIVLRYTEAQIRDTPAAVAADIRRYL